jgi:glycosyltransferase involved in cell wall biosynthesis
MSPYNFVMVLEQNLGHITHTKNLQRAIPQDQAVNADWLLITFPHSTEKDLYARIENLPGIRNNWSLRAGVKTRKAIKHRNGKKPDLYFFHTQVLSLFNYGLMGKTPRVISLDATPLNYDSVGSAYDHQPGNPLMEKIKFKINQKALQSANRLVTWCEWAKKSLIEDYKVKAEIAVIRPGTDLSLWTRQEPKPLDNTKPVKFLFVGGAFKRKGGELLLNVFRRNFLGRNAELHLVTQEQIKLEENEKGKIFVYNGVTGNSPELQRLFREADVFVLPTEADCLPLVMGEAMASSLPIITTNVGAIPEVVVDGKNGFIMKPGDDRMLAKSLETLLDNATLRRQMGEDGRNRAEQEHNAIKNGLQIADWCKGAIQKNL